LVPSACSTSCAVDGLFPLDCTHMTKLINFMIKTE
jgi:hypothetical protein